MPKHQATAERQKRKLKKRQRAYRLKLPGQAPLECDPFQFHYAKDWKLITTLPDDPRLGYVREGVHVERTSLPKMFNFKLDRKLWSTGANIPAVARLYYLIEFYCYPIVNSTSRFEKTKSKQKAKIISNGNI